MSTHKLSRERSLMKFITKFHWNESQKPFRWESDRSLGNVIVSARPSIRILAQNAMLLVWSILNLAIWPGTIVGTEKIQLKFSRKLILILFGNSCRSSHEHTMCGRQFPFSFSNAIDIRFNLLKLMQFVWQIAVCGGVWGLLPNVIISWLWLWMSISFFFLVRHWFVLCPSTNCIRAITAGSVSIVSLCIECSVNVCQQLQNKIQCEWSVCVHKRMNPKNVADVNGSHLSHESKPQNVVGETIFIISFRSRRCCANENKS